MQLTDQRRLQECESVITEHLEEFVRVGTTLREIRDEKLYKAAEFTTFEDYCRKRWEFTARHAYRLMEAAQIRKQLPDYKCDLKGHIWTETHVRQLGRLPTTAKMKAVAERVIDAVESNGGKLTATVVRKAVDQELGKKQKPKRAGDDRLPLTEFMRRWKDRLVNLADELERFPDDAISIASEEEPYVMKDLTEASERIKKRLERIQPSRKRQVGGKE